MKAVQEWEEVNIKDLKKKKAAWEAYTVAVLDRVWVFTDTQVRML